MSTSFVKNLDDVIVPSLVVLVTKLIILFVIPAVAINFFSIARVQNMNFLLAWNIRDAPNYQYNAQFGYSTYGYEQAYIAFFPFYPLLINIVNTILGAGFLQSAFLVSTIASFLLAIFLYKLILLDYDKKIAFDTLLLLFIFPSSLFLHIPYSESTFLLLAVVTFYLIRKQLFLLSAVFIMMATAARIHGIALIPAFFVDLLKFKQELLKKVYFLPFLLILPFLGLFTYLFINYKLYGDFFYFQKIQEHFWQNSFSAYGGIPQAISFITTPFDYRNIDGFAPFALGYSQIFGFLFFLGVIIYGFRKIRASYFIYMFLIFCLSYPTSFWRSMPRFILLAFPIFLLLSLAFKQKPLLRYFVYLTFLGLWIIYSAIALANYSVS